MGGMEVGPKGSWTKGRADSGGFECAAARQQPFCGRDEGDSTSITLRDVEAVERQRKNDIQVEDRPYHMQS